jgi:hypothetical protein
VVAEWTAKGWSAVMVMRRVEASEEVTRPKRRKEGVAEGGWMTSQRKERKKTGFSGSLEERMMRPVWGPERLEGVKMARRGADSPGGMGREGGVRRKLPSEARAFLISRGRSPSLRRMYSWVRGEAGTGPESKEGASQTRRGAADAAVTSDE